jgi:hypothetical protein
MTSDLPDETGALDPGVDRLFRTLTDPAQPAELAGEQDALAMFRANSRPATPAPAGGPAAAPGGPRQPWRSFRVPVRWSVRLAAAVAVALCGGAAAAAYAAVLPASVQHLAHSVLGFAGVPDTQPGSTTPGAGNSGHNTGPSPGRVTHRPRGSSSHTAPSRAGSSPSSLAATPSASVSAGQSVLSAFAASRRIAAGSDAVIDGRLTRSGSGVPGVTITLVERLAGQAGWHVAGTAQTTAAGNVAITVPALTANAVFGLTAPGVVPSGGVVVIVIPQIVSSLAIGPGGVLDNLVVSTQDADTGNLVVLEVQATNGSWRYLRSRELDTSGQTSFSLSGTRLSGREVRVVLVGTIRHGGAIASPVIVPPPS